MSTKSTTDTRPLRQRGLASVFSIWMTKREAEGQRAFRNEQDRQTAIYLANKARMSSGENTNRQTKA